MAEDSGFEFSGEFDDLDNVGDLFGEPSSDEGALGPSNASGAGSEGNAAPDAAGVRGSQDGAEFYAWQVCLADSASNSLMDADDYPDYIVNRETITQMLGIGMASGQNAFPLNGQMFVVAISIQVGEGEIKLIGPDHPRYAAVAAKASEALLEGQDRGMVADLPNGTLVAVKPPADPSKL